jgi:phage tail-like protein
MEKWKNNHFLVEIDGISSPGIDEITGLSLGETGTIEVADAGTNIVDKMSSGLVKWPPLVLVRYADGSVNDQAWLDWFKQMFDYNDPSAALGSSARRNGAIIKIEFATEVARFAFVGAWVKNIMFSDLAAANEDIAKWQITLEHAGMYAEIL